MGSTTSTRKKKCYMYFICTTDWSIQSERPHHVLAVCFVEISCVLTWSPPESCKLLARTTRVAINTTYTTKNHRVSPRLFINIERGPWHIYMIQTLIIRPVKLWGFVHTMVLLSFCFLAACVVFGRIDLSMHTAVIKKNYHGTGVYTTTTVLLLLSIFYSRFFFHYFYFP